MKPGWIIVVALTQADGRTNPQPALVLRRSEPFHDLVVCGISTQLQHCVHGLDEIIRRSDADFATSGLIKDSFFRLGYLATVPPENVAGYVGQISQLRLFRILDRLGQSFQNPIVPINRIIGVIPARFASTRFPGKPLALIAGKPLIQHVVEQCKKAKSLADVIVATDDERIASVAKTFCRVEMTRDDHPSGSDRIAEVAQRLDCDAVVNIQGDEPLIDPAVIDAVTTALNHSEMSTAATQIKFASDYDNPNVVKVVVNAAGRALCFSRRTIPYLRDKVGQASRLSSERESASAEKESSVPVAQDLCRRDALPTLAASGSASEQLAAFPFLKHLGIYGYRRETLLKLVQFPVSPLENAEKLEQLRALENGIQIAVVKVDYDSVGVDVPEDVARVEKLLRTR